jgi:hypothetical protein
MWKTMKLFFSTEILLYYKICYYHMCLINKSIKRNRTNRRDECNVSKHKGEKNDSMIKLNTKKKEDKV